MDFQKILVAVDDSPSSVAAFNYAVEFAQLVNAQLAVATIFEIDQLNVYEYLSPDVLRKQKDKTINLAEEYVRKAKEKGLPAPEAFVDEGGPAEVIIKQILPAYQPDLLICGSFVRKKHKNLLGEQADYMVRNAICSVFIVKNDPSVKP